MKGAEFSAPLDGGDLYLLAEALQGLGPRL